MSIPGSSPYVVVGAGIHGLSTAYHLAKELRARGAGSGADVVVLDKTAPGAGASGIACGVVRNNYFQPAMSELMQACVEVWESDPDAYHYNAVGYIALGRGGAGGGSRGDLRAPGADRLPLGADHRRDGCRRAHEGALPRLARARVSPPACTSTRAASPSTSSRCSGSATSASSEGVSVLEGVEVTGFAFRDDESVSAVETSAGDDRGRRAGRRRAGPLGGTLLVAAWGSPTTIDITTPSGEVVRDRPMWTYWNLQEGEIAVDPLMFATADGDAPPVIHLDTDAPLYTDDGELVTDELWGIYFKRDRHGVQGGASPLVVDGDVELDPYPSTTDVDPSFPDMWCAALSHSMSRFEGCRAQYKMARSGGVGAFTADNFPVFDYVKPNVYGIFDSNHGYKMIGVGREVAAALLGDHSRLLYPFRFERFATGDLHPVSSSPYPWS